MSTRCDQCKKKIGIVGLTCTKCEMRFCTSHIQCELHNCSHDHRKSGQELLKKQLDVGQLKAKLVRIEDD